MSDRRNSRRPISSSKRFAVLKKSGFCCHYCGAKAGDVELQMEHVVPVSKGGTNDPDNLVAACATCNGGKAAKLVDPGKNGKSTAQASHLGPFFVTVVGPAVRGEASGMGWQGRVVEDRGEHLIINRWSWLDGGLVDERVVPMGDVLSGGWRFFPDTESMADFTHERLAVQYDIPKSQIVRWPA